MLQPGLFSLSKLLNEKLYTIPDYQRSYSWESKQRKALFDDINDLHKAQLIEKQWLDQSCCIRTGRYFV